MKKLKIALLSGGNSPEREVSLNSGKQVYAALDREKYDIERYDPAFDLEKLVADAGVIDFALIIMHGPLGEDGSVQGLLDLLEIPYQGSGILGSAAAMDKIVAKRLYMDAGIPVPGHVVLKRIEQFDIKECIAEIGIPLVVKPVSCGSSIGISIVRSEADLEEAVKAAFYEDDEIFLETCIDGVELTCGVMGNETLQALPLIQIVPGDSYDFFDYDAKYVAGATNEICPAPVDEEITRKAQDLGIRAHRALNCEGCSRTDMILDRSGELFVLETNTIPGMTATSLLPQSAKAAGYEFGEFLDELIRLGLDNKRFKRK